MKVEFGKLIVSVIVLAMSLGGSVANADLVAHWGLDGNASDSIGSNHGTLVGNPSWEAGRIGSALLFDGDDYVMIPNESHFDITDEITVAAWIKVTAFDREWQSIITKGDDSWRLARNGIGNNLAFHCTGLTIDGSQWGVEGGVNVDDHRWHHVAGIYDGAGIHLYVDGVLDGSRKASGKISKDDYEVYLGENAQMVGRQFRGLIDDVVVFDHAIKKEEITQLYRLGGISFTSEPTFLMLFNATLKAEEIIKEQRAQEAITFLKKTIAEYEQWKQKDPNAVRLTHKVLSCDLYSLLASAKEASGAPKADVADTYRRATESGILSAPRRGPTLLWLYENTNADEYGDIVETFIQNSSNYIRQVVTQADLMVREQRSQAAVKFLEGNLAAYRRWLAKYPFDDVVAEDMLPEIYFQLAKAKETSGAPMKDVADAYSNTFYPSRFDYIPERVAALTWLVENERTDECVKAIESFTQGHDTRACFKNVVTQVCEHFELEKDWAKFQWFLDILFTRAEYPYDWVVFVESCLGNKTNRWAKAYYTYLDSKPRLLFGRDCIIAEKHVTEEKFARAVELYQDIVNRCGPDDDKEMFEFELCKCLFYGGKYHEAVARLESFIANNKATHRSLVKEAMLMKGRAHVQLSETDEAIDDFFALMIEYPETKEAPETNFFVGYCYMLQGKFELASDAFDCVIKGYPSSVYSSKARLCMTRIKNMTQ